MQTAWLVCDSSWCTVPRLNTSRPTKIAPAPPAPECLHAAPAHHHFTAVDIIDVKYTSSLLAQQVQQQRALFQHGGTLGVLTV